MKLFEWFLNQRERNTPINGPLIKAKAKDIFAKVYPERSEKDFNTSNGWLQKFRRRHGMRYLKICGEILSSDTSAISTFIHEFRGKMEKMQLTKEQVYNADESGLYYRLLPDRTYVAASEKTAPGRKIEKQRIIYVVRKCRRNK